MGASNEQQTHAGGIERKADAGGGRFQCVTRTNEPRRAAARIQQSTAYAHGPMHGWPHVPQLEQNSVTETMPVNFTRLSHPGGFVPAQLAGFAVLPASPP